MTLTFNIKVIFFHTINSRKTVAGNVCLCAYVLLCLCVCACVRSNGVRHRPELEADLVKLPNKTFWIPYVSF